MKKCDNWNCVSYHWGYCTGSDVLVDMVCTQKNVEHKEVEEDNIKDTKWQ